MAMQTERILQNPQHYLIAFLIGLLAVPFWALGAAVFAVAALGIASFAWLSTSLLLDRVERADRQRCLLDAQLLQSQKLASIGELSSGIAHEINNPLAIIGQETEWIRQILGAGSLKDLAELDDLKDSLREIAHQVDRCREITHNLLDFARKKDPLIQEVDINRLIEDMAKLSERETVQRGIRIVRNYRKDLPLIHTDPPLVRQVILNLLNNAAYAVEREGTVELRTAQAENPEEIEISVSDTGCGIPGENLDKIFDPFFTTKPQGKGTGLGLSICHGIVCRLGGRIEVSSEVGKGTVFTICLPIGKKKGEATPCLPSPKSSSSMMKSGSGSL